MCVSWHNASLCVVELRVCLLLLTRLLNFCRVNKQNKQWHSILKPSHVKKCLKNKDWSLTNAVWPRIIGSMKLLSKNLNSRTMIICKFKKINKFKKQTNQPPHTQEGVSIQKQNRRKIFQCKIYLLNEASEFFCFVFCCLFVFFADSKLKIMK